MPAYSFADLLALAPAIVLLLGSLVLLMIEVFQESERRSYQAWFTALTAVIAGLAAIPMLSGEPHPILAVADRAAFAVADRFAGFVTMVICAGLALSALVASSFLHARRAERGEFYVLAMLSASGMILLVQGTDLLFIFVAIEIMSVATYALATWLRRGVRPSEAAFKYFILGAFSSALYLYGVALIFGATGGKTALAEVAAAAANGGPLLAAGISLVAAGFAFKVAAVPFHMWAPDVYEGSPTPVTAFMAVGVKAAAFAALVRVLVVAFGAEGLSAQDGGWGEVVVVLAVLTMLIGNLLAIPQRSVKRLLAYSSIAHAGYILVGVAAAQDAAARASATEGILYYLAAYTFTAVGAFAVVGALERVDGDGPMSWDLDRFAGIARTHPALAAAMAVFMVSLAGIPPTAGFIGKLYVFRAALDADLYWLAIIGVLTSVIGAYYYLRVVIAMFMTEREATVQVVPASSLSLNLALLVAVIGTLALGVLPSLIGDAARASVLAVGAG